VRCCVLMQCTPLLFRRRYACNTHGPGDIIRRGKALPE
jgi:hypothetical protein